MCFLFQLGLMYKAIFVVFIACTLSRFGEWCLKRKWKGRFQLQPIFFFLHYIYDRFWFRSLYLDPLDSLPDDYPQASNKLWSTFWQTPFPHQARNILWRIYHNKLSSKSRLHRIAPSYFTDSSCIFCGWDDEDDEHFLWSCPSK